MSDIRPTGSNLGMTYIFAKTFVHDLDAMANFYQNVLGLIPNNRHQDQMFGRPIDEITFQASYSGGPALTLIKYLDSDGPLAGEAVQGFMTDDLEAVVERTLAHGGSVPEPIRDIPEFGLKVAFIIDPEGHINEVIQMTGAAA
jgi:predicted enzyme related to lactoylglutathione lyase